MATDLEKLVVQLPADIKQYDREIVCAQGVTNAQSRAIENPPAPGQPIAITGDDVEPGIGNADLAHQLRHGGRTYTIRTAGVSDASAILRLADDLASAVQFEIVPERAADTLRAHILDTDKLALVVEADGVVVGWFLGRVGVSIWGHLVAEETAWWVDPTHRGTAWRDILQRYETWAQEKGAFSAMMPASAAMPLVGSLLRRAGYQPTNTHYFKRL